MTVQVTELLLIKGERFSIQERPPLPKGKVVECEYTPEDGFLDLFSSTACWRRYVGKWSIVEEKLYLKNLSGYRRLAEEEPIFASWYTGILTISEPNSDFSFGDLVRPVKPHNVIYQIEQGKVVDIRVALVINDFEVEGEVGFIRFDSLRGKLKRMLQNLVS